MKNQWLRIQLSLVLAAVILAAFSSCATLRAPGDQEVLEVLALISSGDTAALNEASRKPFLLDGEILEGEAAVVLLWKGLADAGFAFHNPVIRDIRPVTPDQYPLFGNTMEVEVFFRKYLTEKDTIIRFNSDEGAFLLILGPKREGHKMAAWGGLQ